MLSSLAEPTELRGIKRNTDLYIQPDIFRDRVFPWIVDYDTVPVIVAGFSSEPVGATEFGKLLHKGHGGFGRLAAIFTVALLSVFLRG